MFSFSPLHINDNACYKLFCFIMGFCCGRWHHIFAYNHRLGVPVYLGSAGEMFQGFPGDLDTGSRESTSPSLESQYLSSVDSFGSPPTTSAPPQVSFFLSWYACDVFPLSTNLATVEMWSITVLHKCSLYFAVLPWLQAMESFYNKAVSIDCLHDEIA